MPHSLAYSSLTRFCGNNYDYIAKKNTRIAVTILLITMVLFAFFEIIAFVLVTQIKHLTTLFELLKKIT